MPGGPSVTDFREDRRLALAVHSEWVYPLREDWIKMKDEAHRKIPHHRHPEIIARLRRAEGHLKSTIEMIVNVRSCLTIAQQLQAVESAIANARKMLIQDHIDHCLEEAAGHIPSDARDVLDEFKAVAKFL
jgi:DNA-binding FrmR family transcriptional regulator